MKIFMWNVRGAASSIVTQHLLEYIYAHKPGVLILTKTKLSSQKARDICGSLPYSSYEFVDAIGFKDGIWILWNERNIKLHIVHRNEQTIQIVVHSLLWLFIRDLNEVLDNCEKFGGNPLNKHRVSLFQDLVDDFELIDLGFFGPKFTWWGKGKNGSVIQERLYRALCNVSWCDIFKDSVIDHLFRTRSHHRPIHVSTVSNSPVDNEPFRLEKFWMDHCAGGVNRDHNGDRISGLSNIGIGNNNAVDAWALRMV
ncbi:hypothetical protein ACH5RR_029192 [Cinchona calisaya]|uniref:Uncharacterized protein n=1 Tax=Cinchona calisaya TaxID=153742 RepID=A0ABD2YSD2_9GENT